MGGVSCQPLLLQFSEVHMSRTQTLKTTLPWWVNANRCFLFVSICSSGMRHPHEAGVLSSGLWRSSSADDARSGYADQFQGSEWTTESDLVLILLVWFFHQWCLLWEVQCITKLNHRETLCWKSVNAFGWVWLTLLIHPFNNVCKQLPNCIYVSISLPSGIATGTGVANTQRDSTGWTGQRRDTRLFYSLMFLYNVLLQSNNRSIVFVCPAETPHCSDKNGAEGFVFIHAPSCVLDPLWPKGN